MLQLLLFAKDAIHRRLGRYILTTVRKTRDDLLHAQVAMLGSVDELEHLAPLRLGELVCGWRLRPRPAIVTYSLGSPALRGARIHADGLACLVLTSTGRNGLIDQAQDYIPLFV